MSTAQIGTISSDTLDNEELFDAFLGALDGLDSEASAKFRAEWLDDLDTDEDFEAFYESESCSDAIAELQNLLNDYAPPFCRFGTLEGDGADFGFWPDHDRIQEVIRASVPFGDRIINADEGVIIEVNDGNVTIWEIETGKELLAIV